MMFDNRIRVYATCPSCNTRVVLVKNWHGPTPNGGIRCDGNFKSDPPHCAQVLPFAQFKYAFTGARWADRFYRQGR